MGQSPGREMRDASPSDISKDRVDPARGQTVPEGLSLFPRALLDILDRTCFPWLSTGASGAG